MAGPIDKAKRVDIPETLEVYAHDSTRIPTAEIVGVLRDLLGNPLVDEEPEAYVNGRLYTRARISSIGEYTVYYSPGGTGPLRDRDQTPWENHSETEDQSGC